MSASNSNKTFAVIDLGSNSFHMMVVENINGCARVVSKVKRKVRLAAGLDDNNILSAEAMQRGWECLAFFGEHLTMLAIDQVEVVATATLRLAINSDDFCNKGNQLLGTKINVISGEQEAALIYHGMAVTSNSADKRLIIDIGGASTELILGSGLAPIVLNSLNMGCVTWLERYFLNGVLSQENFELAIEAAKDVLVPVKDEYLAYEWQLTLGASGTMKAVQEVLMAQGYSENVTLEKLNMLMVQCIDCKLQDKLLLTGLTLDRTPVFVSGLSILIMLFRELPITSMLASGGALREGVIHQLIGDVVENDICLQTCQNIQQRFQINTEQARQVAMIATQFSQQLNISTTLTPYLTFSAMLHEIGLSVDYIDAQNHGLYMLNNMSLAGFSQQQKNLVVALVGNYKGTIEMSLLAQQRCCDEEQVAQLLFCLRLAVICVGRLQASRCHDVSVNKTDNHMTVNIKSGLSKKAPLLMAQLNDEITTSNLTSLLNCRLDIGS